MSPPLHLNGLVEKKEGKCALGQGEYTWLGSAYPGVLNSSSPYSTSSPSIQASPSCLLSQPALRLWDNLDNVSIPEVSYISFHGRVFLCKEYFQS